MRNSNFIVVKGNVNSYRSDLVSIWQRTLFVGKTEQISKRLDWLNNNPSHPCEVYVIKTSGGELVGSAGIIPRTFIFNGHESRTGGLHTDIAILPEYRKSIQPILVLFKSMFDDAKNRYDFLYATPSNASRFIFKRYKYTSVPFNAFVRVIDLTSYIDKKVGNKFLVKSSASVLNLINKSLLITKWLQKDNNFDVSPVSDLFKYQKLINECDFLTTNGVSDHSFPYLDWRYKMFPHCSAYQIFAQDSGIIIFKNQDNVITIMDIICRANNNRKLSVLMYNFQRYCFSVSNARMIMIGLIASKHQAGFFKSHNFIKTTSEYRLYSWSSIGDNITDKVTYTFADGDFIT